MSKRGGNIFLAYISVLILLTFFVILLAQLDPVTTDLLFGRLA